MSISTQLSRIQTNRNTIRAKLVELGMATNADNLDKLTGAIENIVNQGAVSVSVKEGETYTIPAGYHNGSGTVSGVSGGGNYSLQSKTAIPTKKQINVTPDAGYYGLSDVTISAIPDAYQDVTAVTAEAGDVLTGKVYVTADGTVTTGVMINNGAVGKTLDVTAISYVIPKGYHNGEGTVTITLESKTVTPTKEQQNIAPSAGKVLSSVVVEPIPDAYQDITNVTATAATVLDGEVFVSGSGLEVVGEMPNNGTISQSLNTSITTYTIPKGYHSGTGSVKITLDEKSVTPSETSQVITPTTGSLLSKVTVAAIPEQYHDTSNATITADEVLNGKVAYGVDGVVTGSMPNNGAITKILDTVSTSYTVPEGYHDGTGTVSISTETKNVIPTKSVQSISPSAGKVLDKVEVAAIPAAYQDVSLVTATAEEVLVGNVFVSADGSVVGGEMPNNGELTSTLDTKTTAYTIPAGYTAGGTVSLSTETKSVTPTKSEQTLTASSGKVISSFTVDPIPDAYQDVTKVDAVAADVLTGKVIVAADGSVVTGAMANNGSITSTIDGLTVTSVEIPAGYTSGGTVSLTSDIEDALAAI